MDIDTFVKGCMRMKGPATSIDMLSMGYEVTLIHRQNRRLSECIRPPRTSFGRVFQGFGRLWGGVEERVRERERERLLVWLMMLRTCRRFGGDD